MLVTGKVSEQHKHDSPIRFGSCSKYFRRSDSTGSDTSSTPSPLTLRFASSTSSSSSSSPIIILASNQEPLRSVPGIATLSLTNTGRSKRNLLKKFTESEASREVIADRPLELPADVTSQMKSELQNRRVIEEPVPSTSTDSKPIVAPKKPKRKVKVISSWMSQKKRKRKKIK